MAAGLLVLSLTGVPAWGATASRAATPRAATRWEAVAGQTRTERAAKALMAKLEAKKFKDYTIDRVTQAHRSQRFDVERSFPDRRDAAAEVGKLRAAGFHGRVERR
jgi:hypothetical protein